MTRARRRLGLGAFVAVGLAVAVALAFWVGPLASSEPDGLERVAADHGIGPETEAQRWGLDGRLAGALGVTVTFGLASGLTLVARRAAAHRSGPGGDEAPLPETAAGA